jgi:CRP-like cAMP-binding protein
VRRLIVSVGEELSDLLILCESDITTANQKKKAKRLANYVTLVARIAEVIEKDKLRAFQSPLRGDEIMQLCGLRPGPTVGRVKEAIEEAILAGDIPNEYEAAKAYFEEKKEEFLKDVEEWEKA